MRFLKHQMLEAKNLICCSTQLNPKRIIEDLKKINNMLEDNSCPKQDSSCYLIFDDIESAAASMCIPLKENTLEANPSFWIKEHIYLASAIKTRHEGSLDTLKDSLYETQMYMDTQNLSPITPFCCKVLAGLNVEDTQNMIVDIYVGVNPNIIY